MAKDIIAKYVWFVDTLNRYGKLSREDIDTLWMQSSFGNGNPLPERTFYHYRRAIEENFHIDILCNRAGEYYIEKDDNPGAQALANWLLDSYAVNSAVKDSAASERVIVEDVPSSREFLPSVLEAISRTEKISFTYAGFNRSRPETDIVFHPYFVKRYKQRWYMIGFKEKSNDLRTYALDRVKALNILPGKFKMPDLDPEELFSNVIGMTLSKAPVRTVKLQTTPQQAKYFRALPLHPTQQEELNDSYSIFTYQLKLNYELVHEILGYGAAVKVLVPRELQLRVEEELKATLAQYRS